MSIEEQIGEIMRRILREELAMLSNGHDLELLTAEEGEREALMAVARQHEGFSDELPF
jgi:hypothetical protein